MTQNEVNSGELTVTAAKLQDLEALVEILNNALQNKVAHGDMAWGTEPYTAEELRGRIEKGNTYIARLGGESVGTLVLTWEDKRVWGKQPPIAAYVHQLAIKEGYRGRGLGKQLLDWTDQQAASNGRELLRIDFLSENAGLKFYYEGLGFKWVQNKEIQAPHATYEAALYEKPVAYNFKQ